ncbi:hypothetical protein Ato02nite_063030 [Paractinoplanes toevensis]|uniref:Uncharacterized protein n=1 Tax=Paractinoplanes toevensis TaxID=571911 RepID=A0A919THJ5_9ACTN|nr:hypothetical protein Ato02nite_063030 [Actinoplanes toevensis]
MAEVSLGETEPLGDALPDGLGDAGELGTVGVGTGGLSQRHPGLVVCVVRIGLTFSGCGATGGTGTVVAGPGASAAGNAPAAWVRGELGTAATGPSPIPAFGVNVVVAAGGDGTVSAAADVSFSSDPSPFTTPR